MNRGQKTKIGKLVEQTRTAAHKRVVKDGTIQFRLDANSIERLLYLADERKMGAGVLARMWVMEQLNKETENNIDTLSAFVSAADQLTKLQSQMTSLSKTVKTLIAKQAKDS